MDGGGGSDRSIKEGKAPDINHQSCRAVLLLPAIFVLPAGGPARPCGRWLNNAAPLGHGACGQQRRAAHRFHAAGEYRW